MVESGAAEEEFKDHWERFAAHLKQSERSPLTVKNYRSDLKSFAQWLNTARHPRLSFTKVGSAELRQYQEFLLTQQKLSSSSINRRMGALKSFYRWLQQTEGLTDARPILAPGPLREDLDSRWNPLTQEEQRRLLEAVQQGQNKRDIAIIHVLLSTGVRVGELCRLRWVDIKIGDGHRQLVVRMKSIYLDRRPGMSLEACTALLDLGYQEQTDSQAPVFVGQRGGMTPQGVQNVVKKYAQRAGLEKITPQMLRHTYGTWLIERGIRLTEVAILMGVSPQLLVVQYYGDSYR